MAVAPPAAVAVTVVGGYTLAKLFPGLPGPVQDLNIGVVALALNLAVAFAVSLAGRGARRTAMP